MSAPLNSRLSQKRANLKKALNALERSVLAPITEPRDLSGIIKDFEIVYELSWKTLKAFLENEGHQTTTAKDVFGQAFQLSWIKDESVWLEMISDRNQTVHTYDEALARKLAERIRLQYTPAFQHLLKSLKA